MGKDKIVQISAVSTAGGYANRLYALTEAGDIYVRADPTNAEGEWVKLNLPEALEKTDE